MKKIFYFAYGSNMLQERLEARVNDVTRIGTYELKGHKLAFNQGWKESFANIIQADANSIVEGVLYELTQRQIDLLNRFEGYPHNYEQQFFILPSGEIGFAYVSVDPFYYTNRLPSLPYLNLIIEGALQNNLTRTYEALVTFKNQNYKLKKGNKYKLLL